MIEIMLFGVIFLLIVFVGFLLFFLDGTKSQKNKDSVPSQEQSCYYDALSEQAKHIPNK